MRFYLGFWTQVYGELITNKGLEEVAKYAAAIGPDKNTIGRMSPPSTISVVLFVVL